MIPAFAGFGLFVVVAVFAAVVLLLLIIRGVRRGGFSEGSGFSDGWYFFSDFADFGGGDGWFDGGDCGGGDGGGGDGGCGGGD